MKKENLKNTKGITLVALVVTIVVLLILAGVSLNLVLGENGIIAKARDARDATKNDVQDTQTALNSLYDEMEAAINGGSSGGNGGSGDSIDLSALAIGQYVNYTYDIVEEGYPLSGSESGNVTDRIVTQSSTALQWRILNIDEENGTIDLVSSKPTSNIVYFSESIGYNNGVYLLNDMCAHLYSNSSLGITARSINLADMEKHLTTAGFTARNSYTSETDIKYGNPYKYENNRFYPDLYENQLGQGIGVSDITTITEPSIDGIVDPYNESSEYYSTPTSDEYTEASTALTVTQTYYSIPINEANYGPAASVLSQSNSYWVASRYVNTESSSYAYFGLRYASTDVNGDWTYCSFQNQNNLTDSVRLRPVVTLSTNLLDGTKDADGAWNLKTAE